LIAPQGRRPTFAQVYTLSPEAALQLREENVTDALGRTIKHLIMLKMEALMRENPFGQTFQTAGKRVEQAKEEHGGEMPHFQVVNETIFFHIIPKFTDCLAHRPGLAMRCTQAQGRCDGHRTCRRTYCKTSGCHLGTGGWSCPESQR